MRTNEFSWRPRVHVLHERLRDLDDVERQRAQVAERRVAGAEVVEREPDAHRTKLPEARQARVGVLEQLALGDLEHEEGRDRSRPRPAPRAPSSVSSGSLELDGGEVHVDGCGSPGSRLLPGARLHAGLLEHELPQRDDQAGLLGERHELARAAAGRGRGGSSARAPRRPTTSPVARSAIGWYSTSSSPRSTARCELFLQAVALQHGVAHREIEDLEPALARLLRLVHREVGVADQLVRVAAVAGWSRSRC